MKATGIVRRIDELGRIVVPKEIRRTLRIREGDPLEVYTDREGEIILKKYSPVGELSNFATQYTKVLSEMTGRLACICDKDHIVAASGSGKKGLDYDAYEKKIGEAESWFQYQQILLEVMYKISDLSYALNLGAISRENSYALYLPYAKQSEGTLAKLNEWHDEHVKRLEINVEESRRKRQGVEGFFMGALGLFNDDFNYMKMSQSTIARIEHQAENTSTIKGVESEDLYQEDVRLIAKDGKLFYLPQQKDKES